MRRRVGIVAAIVLIAVASSWAENVDPHEDGRRYGWAENMGWLNFEPSEGPGVQVAGEKLVGFVWGENIGWINLSCETTGSCGTVDFGVVNDGQGRLSGFAWAENVGWINFNPQVPGDSTHYGVTIDEQGRFNGRAWGENIGWIRFDAPRSWSVQACIVTLEDLANFAEDWLDVGPVPGNLDATGNVDNEDFAIFSRYWLTFCPDGWQLK